jgi:hypothetical protein
MLHKYAVIITVDNFYLQKESGKRKDVIPKKQIFVYVRICKFRIKTTKKVALKARHSSSI